MSRINGEESVSNEEDGNEDSDDIEKLKQELEQIRSEKAKLEENKLKSDVELEKLRSKDYSFKRLRDMTKEEMEKLSETELELKKQHEQLEDEQRSFRRSTLETYKSDAVERIAKNDKDLAKKIKAAFDEFKGEAEDRKSIEERVIKAYRLVADGKVPSALGYALSPQGDGPSSVEKSKNFSDTLEGKGLANTLGLSIAKKK